MNCKIRWRAVLCTAFLFLCCALSGCGVSFGNMPIGGKEELVFTCAEDGDFGDMAVKDGSVVEESPNSSEGMSEESAETLEKPDTKKINLNTATIEELMTLKGVGESRAQAIIEYRSQNPFTKIEDIMQIPGIKEGIFSKIKDQITVD